MNCKFQWLACLGLLPQLARAQHDSTRTAVPRLGGLSATMLAGERILNGPHKLTIYLDEADRRVANENEAFRRIEVSFRDSVSGTVRVLYPSGKLYSLTPFAHLRAGLRHGIETVWREDGRLLRRTEFVGGLAREVFTYYPNGQVQGHLRKDPDNLLMENFDSLGRPGFYRASRRKDGQFTSDWVRTGGKPPGKRKK